MTFIYSGTCPICGRNNTQKNDHHKRKSSVWGAGETILICKFPCHLAVEEEIKRKENEILRQHPEIYDETLRDFLTQKIDPFEAVGAKRHKPKKRNRRSMELNWFFLSVDLKQEQRAINHEGNFFIWLNMLAWKSNVKVIEQSKKSGKKK